MYRFFFFNFFPSSTIIYFDDIRSSGGSRLQRAYTLDPKATPRPPLSPAADEFHQKHRGRNKNGTDLHESPVISMATSNSSCSTNATSVTTLDFKNPDGGVNDIDDRRSRTVIKSSSHPGSASAIQITEQSSSGHRNHSHDHHQNRHHNRESTDSAHCSPPDRSDGYTSSKKRKMSCT